MNTNETSNSLSLSKESIKSMLKEEKKEEVKLSKRVNSRRRKVVHTSVIDFEPDDEEEKKEEEKKVVVEEGVKVVTVNTLCVYDILNCDSFIVLKDAAKKIEEVYA